MIANIAHLRHLRSGRITSSSQRPDKLSGSYLAQTTCLKARNNPPRNERDFLPASMDWSSP